MSLFMIKQTFKIKRAIMSNKMTPLERFRKTLSHQQPDRPPIMALWVPEVGAALTSCLERQFGECDILEQLEIDFRGIGPRAMTPADSGAVAENAFGIYQDVTSRPLGWIQTLEDVKRFQPHNNPDSFDYSEINEQCLTHDGYVRFTGSPGIFDIVNRLGARGRGYENILCEIMMEDPVVVAMIDKQLDYDHEFLRRTLEAGQGQIEMMWIGEDCGSQRCPLFDPAFFKRWFAPRLRRFIDLGHQHGAAVKLHSCGSNRELLPIFIDIGLDILDVCQPEPAGMEPEGLKRDFGNDITFCGMLSLQETFPHGTAADCRREVEHRIRVIGQNGGYIFSSGNTFTKDIPLANILAAFEAATGKSFANT
jgi:uroporphyrinogen decarboxylase